MILKMIPEKWKLYLQGRLAPLIDAAVRERLTQMQLATFAPDFYRQLFSEAAQITKMIATEMKDSAGSYLPYHAGERSFLIAKSDRNSVGTCELGFPVPPKDLWLHYGHTKEEYLASGRITVNDMLGTLKESGHSFRKRGRILDFGCGAGRMIRWLKDEARKHEIWGVDIGSEHVFWCQQHLTPPFHFATTTTLPHLPFEDRSFDFIYAGSVFTHIDDLARMWLLELQRILTEGGMFYATIHDKKTVELLQGAWQNHGFAQLMLRNEKYREYTSTDFAMFAVGRSVNSHIFYDIDYFCEMVSPYFEPILVKEEAYAYQTAVLLRRL